MSMTGLSGKTRSFVSRTAKRLLFAPALPWVISRLRGANGGCLWVLCYHEVSDDPLKHQLLPGVVITRKDLLRSIKALRRHFRVASLWDSLQRLEQQQLTEPTVAITFDDGYSGFFTDVLPILEETDTCATVFVCGDPVRHRRWTWDWELFHLRRIAGPAALEALLGAFDDTTSGIREAAASRLTRALIDVIHQEAFRHPLPDANPLYLTEEQLRFVPQDRVEIGGHTWSHARVEAMPEEDWKRELSENHAYLSQFPAYRPIQAIPFGGQRDHCTPQMVEWANRILGVRTFTSYGGVCREPGPDRDYFRLGMEDVPATALLGHLALHGWRFSWDRTFA